MKQQKQKKFQLKQLKHRLLRNNLEKIIGYMFSFFPREALIFELKNNEPIHMFFVFFRMKAVWLDENKNVIQIDDCAPFALRTWSCPEAKYLIEFPSKWNLDIDVNDKLHF